MSEFPFLSALGHRFCDFLAFRRVGGIDSKSDRELLRYFDRFLAQEGVSFRQSCVEGDFARPMMHIRGILIPK